MKVPVSFLSLGPGDPELLTLKVIKTLRESDIVVVPSTAGRSRAAEIIREWCNEDKMRHYELPMQKDRTEVRKVYDDICQQVVAWYNEGQHIGTTKDNTSPSLSRATSASMHLFTTCWTN